MSRGDKGESFRPDKCEHGPEDGCMWCCRECNLARHLCPGCGAGLNHGEAVCSDCEERYK